MRIDTISVQRADKGYVTTAESINGRDARELAAALGFSNGALDTGYAIYALVEKVKPDEFIWRDRTCYSDGWHFDPSIGESVRRWDELRAHFLMVTRSDRKADAHLTALQQEHCNRLNIRSGPRRIVKLIPCEKVSAYPDSTFRNIPQWELLVMKQFERVTAMLPGNHGKVHLA